MEEQNKPYIIGVDLGGTNLLAVVSTREGEILIRKKEETRAGEGPEAVINQISENVDEVIGLQGIKKEQVLAAGVCAAGFYNYKKELIVESPNLKNWTRVSLGPALEEKLGLPVLVENDANAAAYGEYRRGAGQGSSHIIYITVSTGIGGGVIVDGKIFRGAQGYAGEIGHTTIDINGPRCTCGNQGCLETLASGTAIARKACEVLAVGKSTKMLEVAAMEGREDVTARHVFTAAQLGDEAAAEILKITLEYLGAGLASMANLFNPEIFVIGGGVSMSGDSFFQPLKKVFCRRAAGPVSETVGILPAALGDEAGITGVILLAAEHFPGRKGPGD